MATNYYKKKTKKDSQKKHVKDIKIFLKNKKTKGKKRLENITKILLKKKKKKGVIRILLRNERRNYIYEYRSMSIVYIEFSYQVFQDLFIFFLLCNVKNF